MNRGAWVVRLALFIALAGTVWGMTVMVSAASGIGVSLLPPNTAWTGTWAVAPQSSPATFDRQTLRQIVPTGSGGAVARIRLSNAFGTAPLTIADVHLADSTGGAAIRPGTDHAVTFGGSTTVTVPAGGSVASDAIPLALAAHTDVAVSLYLPRATGPAVTHALDAPSSYVAAGDVSGSTELGTATTVGGYYFLTNLDVDDTAAGAACLPAKPACRPTPTR